MINRKERDAISEKFPDVSIVRTMKGDSKRKHYYLEERRDVMRFLREYRNKSVIEEHPRKKYKNYNRRKPKRRGV